LIAGTLRNPAFANAAQYPAKQPWSRRRGDLFLSRTRRVDAARPGGCLPVGVLAIYESRCLIQQEIIKLRLDSGDRSIEFRQGKQPYFYTKYKVYQTRWFAILKLVDTDKSRTLILNSDCFNSIQAYQQLRYQLCKMERTGAA
jgi:hypothetical protein